MDDDKTHTLRYGDESHSPLIEGMIGGNWLEQE